MFKQVIKALHFLEDSTLILLLVALIILGAIQIILRNAGVSGFLWADPASRIIVLWLAMFGAMRASRLQNHISIDLLSHYGTPKIQRISHFVVSISCTAICAIAVYYSFLFVQIEYKDGLDAYLNVPAWLCEAIIPFSLCIIGIRFAFHSLTVPAASDDS
jgi:TRAP-type C4-dicarboxylate transport system permease small subunit